MYIDGKCAIVTGGSGGIGKAIAKLLARRGANVFLIARTEELLRATIDELKNEADSASQRFGFFSADVSDLAAVQDAVKAAEAECGPAAILVNSAGFHRTGYVEKIPISDIEDEIRVNYLGTVYMAKQILSGMMERREGWIMNISSLAGLKGIFGYAGYSGSKFAVVGFSEALPLHTRQSRAWRAVHSLSFPASPARCSMLPTESRPGWSTWSLTGQLTKRGRKGDSKILLLKLV